MADKAHHEPSKLPYQLLKQITNDFDRERILGSGGFGTVYKGEHQNGEEIAVKVLHNISGLDGTEFELKEFNNLRGLKHPNIVELVGFCDELEEEEVTVEGKQVTAVRVRTALCSEYVQNGSLHRRISDECTGFNWRTRYEIIKGVCEGLKYLREGLESPVMHFNLKPDNILLDKYMTPKIADFGLSRLFGYENTTKTMSSIGTRGYWPPEYIKHQVISKEFDIFSLGVIIIKIMTGHEGYNRISDMATRKFAKHVLENWRKKLQPILSHTELEAYCTQVKRCIEIALDCLNPNRQERPTIQYIVSSLEATEIMIVEDGWLQNNQSTSRPTIQHIVSSLEETEIMIDVQPLELCFFPLLLSSEGRKTAGMGSCLLQLNNRGRDRVAFMLVANSPKRYLTKKPLCGIVPPRCTYTLALTMTNKLPLLSDIGDFFTLYAITVGEYDLRYVDKGLVNIEYDDFFNKARATEDGEEVQEVTLKAICDQPAEEGTSSSNVQALVFGQPVQQLRIMTTHHVGSLRFWNYKTMETLNSFQVTDEPVHAAKFIAREEWVVAGDGNGCIHVYSYGGQEEVEIFDAHDSCITTLAVHQTHPFVISSSSDDDHLIKLWDWSKDWKCTKTFRGHTDRVTQVTFNKTDNDTFTSASWDGTIKIWSMCSDDPSIIMTLDGETDSLLCFEYFTRFDRQHLIAGCKDKTAQIWDLGITGGYVDALEGHADHITAIKLHPEHQMLITGSLDGTVHIWDSTTYKLENIISFNLGAIYSFVCISGSRRIMVGCHQGLAMIKVTLKTPRAEPLLHWPKPAQDWEGKLVDEVDLKVTFTAKVPQESTMPPAEEESKFCRDDPGQSIIPSKSSITSMPSSGHAEASRSTHTNNYLSAAEPMAMTFQELHRITDGFSEKRLLGKGGFGMVYKGVLDNGEVIAVKKLHNTPGLVEVQFKNELLNLMMVKHENIIQLVGYCSEAKQIVNEHKGKKDLVYREERALCLEYLQGGNLEELLSDKSCELDWEERYRIIKGICLGLKHLHTGSSDPIYHLDLKPANILLDSNRIPKIGDFGLSRLRDSTETFVTKTYSGTNLYMPPEYMHRQQISSKFDVFSLGVIMIQIIAGPDGYYNYKCEMSPEEFIDHVTENWSKRLQAKTMSPTELLEIQRCIELALRCVEDKQSERPSITEIVEELNMVSKCTPFDADAGEESSLVALSNS